MQAFLQPGFWVFVLVMAGIYCIFALGLQIQYGLGGMMNFGHVGMMALSAYSLAILVITYGWNLYLAAFAGVAVAALGGALLGLTTIRLRGDYFAIVSIAFSEIVRYVIQNSDNFTGGTRGSLAIPSKSGAFTSYTKTFEPVLLKIQDLFSPIFGDVVNRDFAMLLIVWATAGLLLLFVSRTQMTSWARVLRATREDDHVPSALGKNVFMFRLQALIFGSAIGGIAGIFWSLQFSILAPEDFQSIVTFYGWMILIMGGATRVKGVPVGALFFGFLYAGTRFFEFPPFTWFTSAERAYLRIIIIGLVLIILMIKRPQGMFGKREEMVLDQ
jgi:branched-chain amino acid transport system permease protein